MRRLVALNIALALSLVASCSQSDFTGSSGGNASSKSGKVDDHGKNGSGIDGVDAGEDAGSDSGIDAGVDSDRKSGGEGSDVDTGMGGDVLFDEDDLAVKLTQPVDQCRWSIWFRKDVTMPGEQLKSPQQCNNSEYLAGMGYQAFTGKADGVARIYCCPTPKLDLEAFRRKDCAWSDWMVNAQENQCDVGKYVADVDYSAQESQGVGDGKMRVNCCRAAENKTLNQNKCEWSDWFAAEAGKERHQCAVGKYIAGVGYDRNADGSQGGRVKVFCCAP